MNQFACVCVTRQGDDISGIPDLGYHWHRWTRVDYQNWLDGHLHGPEFSEESFKRISLKIKKNPLPIADN